jgi:hypothetical protein
LSFVIHADADEGLQFQSLLSDFRVGTRIVTHGSKLIDESIVHGELAQVGPVGLRVVVEGGHVGRLNLATVGAHGEVSVIDAILVDPRGEVDVESGVDQLLLPGSDSGLLLLDGGGRADHLPLVYLSINE